MLQAGDYSALTFYLNAVKATGTDDGETVMKWMKSNKINDFFTQGGYVREDGRMIHDMYLMQVKTPAESRAVGLQGRGHAARRRGLHQTVRIDLQAGQEVNPVHRPHEATWSIRPGRFLDLLASICTRRTFTR